MGAQMIQLQKDTFLRQFFESGGLVRRGVAPAQDAQGGLAVPKPGFHDRISCHLLRMEQSDHGAAVGVSANHDMTDAQSGYSILDDGRDAAQHSAMRGNKVADVPGNENLPRTRLR